MKICLFCGKDISHKHHSSKFCNEECRKSYVFKQKLLENQDKDWPQCRICGMKQRDLKTHITKYHGVSTKDYFEKYGKHSLISEDVRKKYSDRLKGEKNPGFNHCGKLSPFSEKFVAYKDLSEEERKQKAYNLSLKANKTMCDNENRNTSIEFYLKKTAGNIKEAEILLKERQAVFTLEKCVKKYGNIEGLKIWKERQDKWQNTLNNKTIEEKREINKKKVPLHLNNKKSYSKISQEIYWILYNKIKYDFKEIYFATLHDKEYSEMFNNEFRLEIDYANSYYAFLDFYINFSL